MVTSTRKRKRAADEDYVPEPSRGKRKNPVYQPSALFSSLADRSADILQLAQLWVADYEENTTEAVAALVNFLLESCGCRTLVQAHDVLNPEAAPATVTEVALMFERQRTHEFPFAQTGKELKFFKQNVVAFFKGVVSIPFEKELLEDDESVVDCLLAWLAALSASTIRPFRLVATTVVLAIQTQLCENHVGVLVFIEKQQRLLSVAKSRRKRSNAVIENIERSIERGLAQKSAVAGFINDIIAQVFVHRYRDIDASIRAECVRGMGLWMLTDAEFFLQLNYLRFLGWLLSDPQDSVRDEVLRVLLKLYQAAPSGDSMSPGFRQFTDRFKPQLVNMVWSEKRVASKATAINVHASLFDLGFLEEEDKRCVALYAFHILQQGSPSERLLTETGKFIAKVCQLAAKETLDKFQGFLDMHTSAQLGDEEDQLHLEKSVLLKETIRFLREAYDAYQNTTRPDAAQSIFTAEGMVSDIFSRVYPLSGYAGSWLGIINYITFDISAVQFMTLQGNETESPEEDELLAYLELDTQEDQFLMLSLVSGSLDAIFNGKRSKTESDDADEPANVLSTLSNLVMRLEDVSKRHFTSYAAFMKTCNTLLCLPNSGLPHAYESKGQIDAYNSLIGCLLLYFMDMPHNPQLERVYDDFFATLLKGFEIVDGVLLPTSILGLVTGSITLRIEDMLLALASEFLESFKESIEVDPDTPDLEVQRKIVGQMVPATLPLQKLAQLSKAINVNKYVSEPVLTYSATVNQTLQKRFLEVIDMASFAQLWPHHYARLMPDFKNAWEAIANFSLSTLCWKLEDLLYAGNDSVIATIDLALYFEGYGLLLHALAMNVVDVDKSVQSLISKDDEGELLKSTLELSSELCLSLSDMLVAVRVFYVKFRTQAMSEQDEVFQDRRGFGAFVRGIIPLETEKALMNEYFLKEAQVAVLRGETLERQNGEGVNLEDIADKPPLVEESEDEDEGDEDEVLMRRAEKDVLRARQRFQREQALWEAERDLCAYLVKLLSLKRTMGLLESAGNRLKLNAEKMGSLYQQILAQADAPLEAEQSATEPEETEPAVSASNAPPNDVADQFLDDDLAIPSDPEID